LLYKRNVIFNYIRRTLFYSAGRKGLSQVNMPFSIWAIHVPQKLKQKDPH